MIECKSVHQLAAAIRSARAALNWSQQELSMRSKVSLPTIARIESLNAANPRLSTVFRLIDTLEAAGIDFNWTSPSQDFSISVRLGHTVGRNCANSDFSAALSTK
jgi:transcriptional regulator with XRE-family HTH domain